MTATTTVRVGDAVTIRNPHDWLNNGKAARVLEVREDGRLRVTRSTESGDVIRWTVRADRVER